MTSWTKQVWLVGVGWGGVDRTLDRSISSQWSKSIFFISGTWCEAGFLQLVLWCIRLWDRTRHLQGTSVTRTARFRGAVDVFWSSLRFVALISLWIDQRSTVLSYLLCWNIKKKLTDMQKEELNKLNTVCVQNTIQRLQYMSKFTKPLITPVLLVRLSWHMQCCKAK